MTKGGNVSESEVNQHDGIFSPSQEPVEDKKLSHTEKVAGVDRVREETYNSSLLMTPSREWPAEIKYWTWDNSQHSENYRALWGSCFAPKVTVGARSHYIHAHCDLTVAPCWQGTAARPTIPPSTPQSNGRSMYSSMAMGTSCCHFNIIVKVGGSERWMYVPVCSQFTSVRIWFVFLTASSTNQQGLQAQMQRQ